MGRSWDSSQQEAEAWAGGAADSVRGQILGTLRRQRALGLLVDWWKGWKEERPQGDHGVGPK